MTVAIKWLCERLPALAETDVPLTRRLFRPPMLSALVAHVALTNVDGTQLLDLCHLPEGYPTGYNSAPLTHSPLRGHSRGLTNDQDASDELMVETLCGDCMANGTCAQLGEQVDCGEFGCGSRVGSSSMVEHVQCCSYGRTFRCE